MTSPLSDGHRVVRGVLSPDDVASLRDAITETIDRVARALRTPFETSCPESPFEERLEHVARHDHAYAFALYQAVMADAQRDARVLALAQHPDLAAVLQQVLAPLVPEGHILRTRAAVPTFSSQRSRWHQDVVRDGDPRFARTSPPTGCGRVRVACWMPLSDVDETSGALEVMPGEWEEPFRHDAGEQGQFFIPEEALPAGPRQVVPLRRGDVLLLDRFIPHRSLPVSGGRVRWAVVMWVKAGPVPAPRSRSDREQGGTPGSTPGVPVDAQPC